MMENKEIPKTTNPYARTAPVKYVKCNLLDHRSSDCPLRKAIHFVEREEEEENEVLCEPDGPGKEAEAYEDDDEGRSYVMRKLMLTHKQEESTQRHQLFKTRCTINDKMFELIIDSGSFENIISREAVRELKLPMEKHPHLYTIRWIKTA